MKCAYAIFNFGFLKGMSFLLPKTFSKYKFDKNHILNLDTAKRQEVGLKKSSFGSWSDEEKLMDEILQEEVENDQLQKNMAQNKTWQQRDEDERLMDEILGVDTMKSPEKSKKLKRVSFCESTAEVFVGDIEGSKQLEAMKTNTHQIKAFNHLEE